MDGQQSIITHGIAVTGGSSDGLYPNFIRSMANNGGGTYHSASDAETLLKALLGIFNQMQPVNSVFASASLPVSVNSRGTYLNQVFMGMFRPDAEAKPRWPGNSSSTVRPRRPGHAAARRLDRHLGGQLVDRLHQPERDLVLDRAEHLLEQPAAGHAALVERLARRRHRGEGAAAQQTRRPMPPRRMAAVYTCVDCASNTVLGAGMSTRFNTANNLLTPALLGVDTATRDPLIDWVRGTNNAGAELGPTTGPLTTIRPSVHGDVLHSRPAVVNYGGSIGVVVFYGANDGMLRAVNGNQTGTGAGNELWSFVPQEFFGQLNRLRSNSPNIRLPSTPAGSSATPRDYFVDGPIGLYQRFAADGTVEKAMIFVGMRRGGRQIYAFDVTTPANPARNSSGRRPMRTSAGSARRGRSRAWPRSAATPIGGGLRRWLRRRGGRRSHPGHDDDGQRGLRAGRVHRHPPEELPDEPQRAGRRQPRRFRFRRLDRPRLRG